MANRVYFGLKLGTLHVMHERRVAEAAGLRRLFQEQWTQLVRFWEDRASLRREKREKGKALHAAVESIVDGTDNRMRALTGYRKALREAAHQVLAHIQALTEQVPGPFLISPDDYLSDPRVNAFFANKQEITHIVGRCRELHEFYANNPGHTEPAFLMLLMSRREKRVFGVDGENGILQRETLQTTVNFRDHRILAPCRDESQLRSALSRHLFDSLVQYVSQRMMKWRYGSEPSRNSAALQSCNPKSYLDELIRQLAAPKELLRIEQNALRISKMGVKLDENSTQPANEFTLDEVELGDLPPKAIVLPRYPQQAMAEPLQPFAP